MSSVTIHEESKILFITKKNNPIIRVELKSVFFSGKKIVVAYKQCISYHNCSARWVLSATKFRLFSTDRFNTITFSIRLCKVSGEASFPVLDRVLKEENFGKQWIWNCFFLFEIKWFDLLKHNTKYNNKYNTIILIVYSFNIINWRAYYLDKSCHVNYAIWSLTLQISI